MTIPVELEIRGKKIVEKALIDTGASSTFISKRLLRKLRLRTRALEKRIMVGNVDGSPNQTPFITHYTMLPMKLGSIYMNERCLVIQLGTEDLILGLDWLRRHNPEINWATGQITIKPTRINVGRITISPQIINNISTKLAQEKHKPKDVNLLEQIPKEYHEYLKVFEKQASHRLPEHRIWDHEINLRADWKPKPSKVYPLTLNEEEEMNKFIDENLEKGYIRPSKSPYAAPFFFVDKKDASLRPCQDYRDLNSGTIEDKYPIPLISDLIDKLHGSKIFTKLDLRAGYNNVRIKEGDEHKAAFKTKRGLFEPLVMFFGLCNSPATFQKMMNEIFKDMIDEGWILIYMDDILIHSTEQQLQTERTKRVLQRLTEHDLYLKIEKCKFNQKEVEFLGMIIRHNEVIMDPVKLAGIADWPIPKNVKEVRSFLGFGNFYRKFINGYSKLAEPMTRLTKGEQKWEWTHEQQQAFDKLKEEFKKEPVLMIPDPRKPFKLATDASNVATGAVLSQKDVNGNWRPCGFTSESLKAAQRNYQIYDRELLAVIRGLQAWRHLLLGSPHPVHIVTDHMNLLYFTQPQNLNRRQARWQLYLSQFNFRLEHEKGTKMQVPDALSRRADHFKGTEHDNENIILLPDKLFIKVIDEELKKKFTEAKKEDVIIDAINALKGEGIPPLRTALEDWREEDGLIFFRNKCYVPEDHELRKEIVRRHHDLPPFGHPGIWPTKVNVSKDYWWPGLATFVKNYVDGCAVCQQNKVNTHPTTPPLHPIKGSRRPWAQLTADIISALPKVGSLDSVLVIVDQGLTKGVIFEPCSKNIDAAGVAKIFINRVYRQYGLHDSLTTDRGSQFESKFAREMGNSLGVKLKFSTAYHPQTDGQTERVNQELETYLRILCANHPDKWPEYLPLAEFTHNNRIHSAIHMSPFQAIMGYEPRTIPTTFPETSVPSVNQRIKNLQNIRDEAAAAHEIARQKMAERVRKKYEPFKLGEKVWLEATNLKLNTPNRKLSHKREGPFKIIEVLGPVTFKLELPNQWKQRNIHPVFHASLLSKYKENDIHGPNYTDPPPDLIGGEEEWEVEAITNHKRFRNGMRYLVRWKGYSSAEDSWQTANELKNARKILNDYKKKHKLT